MGSSFSICRESQENRDEHLKASLHSFKENIAWENNGKNPFLYYEKISDLGRGSMGAVMWVQKKKVGGSARLNSDKKEKKKKTEVWGEKKLEFAMKTIILDRISQLFLDELRNEIEILRNLDHPNIVKLYEIYDMRTQIYLIMELCSGGDLWTRAPYTEREAMKIMQNLLSAITHMHNEGITHRDLKFENIMFENKSPDAEIKLLDFGLSKKFRPGEILNRGVGTIYTMAPEVLEGKYTSQADLWSLGVIAYILLSNKKPFDGYRRNEVIAKILRCEYNFRDPIWKYISREARRFVQRLIEYFPDKRSTAEEANNSPWFQREHTDVNNDEFKKIIGNTVIEYHSDNSLLRKLGLIIIAHQSPTSEILKLRSAFEELDKNNDGILSLDEFKSVLKEKGYTDSEAEFSYSNMDLYGEGIVHYTEFLASTVENQGFLEEERIAEAFDRIDSDNTGYISKSNLKKLLGKDYDSGAVKDAIDELDDNKDGKISFDEFKKCFLQKKNSSLSATNAEEIYKKQDSV